MSNQEFQRRFKVRVTDKATGKVIHDGAESSGVYAPIPRPQKVGDFAEYVVEVVYLRDRQYRKSYATRLAKRKQEEDARKLREAEELKKAVIRRRARIMNQIELAFVKQGKDAVKFVTCHVCDDLAQVLILAQEIHGSDVVQPDQITGALCANHMPGPWSKTPMVDCAILEFFYDGLKQIYINRALAAAAAK